MLNLPLSYILKEIRQSDFYDNGTLISSCIIQYLLFSNNVWYEVVLDDGISTIKTCREPKISEPDLAYQEFQYPVIAYNSINLEKLGKLRKIYEFFWKGILDESCGFQFEFSSNQSIYIIESNGTPTITDNPIYIKNEWTKKEKKGLNH